MFSSKTSELHQAAWRAIAADKRYLYLIPANDTHRDASLVAPMNRSRDGTAIRASRILGASLEHVDPDDTDGFIEYIFIDEGQFIHGIEQYALRQRDAGRHVYIACLRTSVTGAVWPHTNNLIAAHADRIVVKTGVCIVCSRDAHYTRLKRESVRGADPRELVGGDELFACACHAHMFDPVTLDEATLARAERVVTRLREATQ